MRVSRFISLFILILLTTVSFSQKTIRITNQTTGVPLPFATIANLSQSIVRHADEVGQFLFEGADSDTLRVTYIGYHPRIVQLKNISDNVIKLEEATTVMPAVTVQSCKHPLTKRFTNFDSASTYPPFGGLSWQNNINGALAGVIITSPSPNTTLTHLVFELKKAFGAPKGIPKAPIRFSFYSVNPESHLPGEPLTYETMLYVPKKIGKQKVDVQNLGVMIPSSGMYVVLEPLINAEDCYPISYCDSIRNVDTVLMNYRLMFEGVRSIGFTLVICDYRTNQWKFSFRRLTMEADKPHSTIKFGIIYKTCSPK